MPVVIFGIFILDTYRNLDDTFITYVPIVEKDIGLPKPFWAEMNLGDVLMLSPIPDESCIFPRLISIVMT